MIPSALPRLRLDERGGISWVTLLLLVLLAAGGYLAVVWGPIYIVRYEAKVVTGEIANQAVHERDDAKLVKALCDKLGGLAQVKAPEADGSISEVRAVDVRPEDVTWERDASGTPRTLHVAFDYTTSVYYPIFDRFTEKTFTIDMVRDITPVKW
jgi:hypothetical protein